MRILIAGSSGMIGSVVTPFLAGHGHEVIRLVRRVPVTGEVYWDPDAGVIDSLGLEGFDGVVQLATMPWPMRWSAKSKQQMRSNRIGANGLLARTLASCKRKPQVLICASGMGIYPSSGETVLTEESSVGTNFLAQLQCDGEAATASASTAGIRVVNLRIPPVVGSPKLKRGTGRLGNGLQWTSWVSLDELASIVEHVLMTGTLVGPLNPASPNPVRNTEFSATSSRVLGVKAGLPIPAFVLRLMMGEIADALLLASRRIEPQKLLASGYRFLYPKLEDALRHGLEGQII